MRPNKIISGGQTGADLGALAAANQLGIPTGGWMPRGFLTEVGPQPSMQELYGMQEHHSHDYVPRTRRNVRDADGTIWVAGDDTDSRGKVATYNAARRYGKPFLNNPSSETLRGWMMEWNIKILNVAGPRASRDQQAFDRAANLILEAFEVTV